ncbi:MAG: DNA-binding protein HU [bacterium (Candidatus Ratteibacteria) CG_4_10_14_3_um_filter_41_18]|uniref:DNA-binding protein HU n=4 Tax=Candidatus Ratteibacteria TaxID=2979319 RepID=A0A2M7M276_9BACT|nr:MAG: DNA-binding protein HU [Candidatus Omnitrophica bacterium CG1_02_41_171]PIW33271.1 MAG: DNA-binding protein HU [bacterium (Candidatus Ratteibacteria) CG15_BIG_FIL_POST_REV_8_21_14_020_41_12]PIW74374.1 MAG: DNA-binding protein HU [bacterium (Candidatus Ratteibacteria) CG_4_8_14_3_um_filter_41_36]PIX76817.1 MAG: DNA-binding protein HU [bacterium (Candidatus Ratteibacteria) CG_4_10_14_3_um_filter_41_18]
MNKGQLIEKVVTETDISKAQATKAVDSLVNNIRNSLKNGEKVVLAGLGTFSVKKRKARTGRNPRTGEQLSIPERKVAAFKAGKTLKEAVK